MTNAMVLERTSNLVMPSHYVELDDEEMSYVDGGIYVSYNTLQAAVWASGKNGANIGGAISAYSAAFGGIAAMFSTYASSLFSWVNALPIVGQIIFAYVLANAITVGIAMATAYVQKKGVDIGVGWWWFIPHVKINIK